ncbi:MAG: nitroreductase family protein [Terrisporobacter othiniensis]|uniref:Nitroreductase family protein n=2 Tax=Terrisporobacter TaxID=1505652 RepID=A0AAX2ZHM3_9FIRM|nr:MULTISPECIES: nitroreductase family protein [Terrisporobacter]MBN9645455.1 nitroreductase family protein [Terrisporobacter glycolicus]MDU4862671.1 nitroreductase family protein [Terrisporobacter othiniensis]MDU6995473.1 nitroreductase family protein [Terrisporobacter othiniensis]UEL47975.1 nitroreductase family protein [Terrisporobacter hibernicus]UPA32026.1 nitroreductase family protein [Terrisporobacter glycolicus]
MANLDMIYNRKSVRKFKDVEVPREDILKMLEAATEAPSPKHQQNWNFVVITSKELINKMAEIVAKSHEKIGEIAKTEKDRKIHMSVLKYYTSFKNAPAVVMVYSKPYDMIEYKILKENGATKEVLDVLVSPQSAAQAIGAAVENFLLAATEMGYGSCYMTGPTHAKAELEKLIGFEKPNYELMSMISVGIAEDNTPAKLPRKPLQEVVTFID